ncbi:YjzD family protein [Cytobacillus depressus]|uniref:YjzD family protein n=1 Tax=Cytobacillus depressus TaxID=1602942 RepID=A0A6L3V772_9BACI|nr:YjzD family protein [Cytobacillus depressus]KAB2337196.1 YjzD family protein [Cytobacillus depressus]
MRFFWTLFWTFLLVQMLTYVVSSMIGIAFDFKTGSILGVAATIVIFIVTTILPEGPVEKERLN